MHLEQLAHRRSLEGRCAGQELVEHAPQGIDVGASVHQGPHRLLRSDVEGRSRHSHLNIQYFTRLTPAEPSRQSEVHQYRPVAVDDHDVVGLEVPVNDALPMEVGQGLTESADDRQRVDQVRCRALPAFTAPPGQGDSREKLHGVPGHPPLVALLDDAHDPGVGEARQSPNLPPDPVNHGATLRVDDLDGSLVSVTPVPAPDHGPHAASAQDSDHFVGAVTSRLVGNRGPGRTSNCLGCPWIFEVGHG